MLHATDQQAENLNQTGRFAVGTIWAHVPVASMFSEHPPKLQGGEQDVQHWRQKPTPRPLACGWLERQGANLRELRRHPGPSRAIAQLVQRAHHAKRKIGIDRVRRLAGRREGHTTRWTIEWLAWSQLNRQGVTSETLKSGDHLVITGFPSRNPEDHRL
jgi:hypothetical protein